MRLTPLTQPIILFIQRLRDRLAGYSRSKKVYISIGGVVFVFIVVTSLSFRLPSATVLSYSHETCASTVVPLPGLVSAAGESLDIYVDKTVEIAGYPLLAREVCVSPKQVPVPGKTMHGNVVLPGFGAMKKSVSVEVPEYPEPEVMEFARPVEAVSIRDDIELRFTQPDRLFTYYLVGNESREACQKQRVFLRCSLGGLNLLQAHEYEVEILRTFRGSVVGEVQQRNIRTLDPLEVTDSSIEADELVYERPNRLDITFNKPLKTETLRADFVNQAGEVVEHELTPGEKKLQLEFIEDLPREETYQFTIEYAEADDNSVLIEPWQLEFHTSAGPTITGSNVHEGKLSVDHSFRVEFDQPLAESQPLDNLVNLTHQGNPIDASVKVSHDELIITPSSSLPRCQTLALAIAGDLVSEYTVEASVNWRTTARTTCSQSRTIGYSVEGRPITAYSFGDGPKKVLYVGGMHGNEWSSVVLMNAWMDELDKRFHEIPDDHTVIVIPNSSPDSGVADSRLNANEVDLNRNFPTDDWQSEVQIPGPTLLPEGGGTSALSEPESEALAKFVRTQRPQLVLTYHAVASVVIGNDVGQANDWAKTYADQAGYEFATNDQLNQVFNYSATGAFEDWLNDELAIPALLVELGTMYDDEMQRNRDALWHSLTVL